MQQKFLQLKISRWIISLLFGLILNQLYGQNGANDATFNLQDIGNGFGDEANNTVLASTLQPDGKILIGGLFTNLNGEVRNRIARLNEDGSTDHTFNAVPGVNSSVRAICLQPDGKILIGGNFVTVNGFSKSKIARLNQDGSVDLTFSNQAQFNESVYTISLDSDGKILIGGSFTLFSGIPCSRLVRLNSDGTLDNTFNVGSGADEIVKTCAIQADGKILVAGNFTIFNGVSVGRIVRLNNDGTIDNTFNVGSGADAAVETLGVQSDGKIIVGGSYTSFSGNSANRIIRLQPNGTVDISFNAPLGINGPVNVCRIESDGNIIIGGAFFNVDGLNNHRQYFMRLHQNGAEDSGFWPDQGASSLTIYTIELLSSGKIFLGGTIGYVDECYNGNYVIVEHNGVLDETFNSGTGANDVIFSTDVQSDGKIIVGGLFNTMNGLPVYRNKFARLNEDGSVDSTFVPDVTDRFVMINSVFVQPDNKVLIGGSHSAGTVDGLIRLNQLGSIDTTFNSEADDMIIYSLNIQSDGKIIVGGWGNTTNIRRLNLNGTIDQQFAAPAITSSSFSSGVNRVYSTDIQSDGKILIGGQFNLVGGISMNNPLIRLNPDGSLDASFMSNSSFNGQIRIIRFLPNGKILVGGDFTLVNGISSKRMVRLNPDGSLDGTFNIGSGFNGIVTDIEVDGNGKIIVVGGFTSYDGNQINQILRLNPDGGLDVSFFPGVGANNIIYTCSRQNDNLIIGGAFTKYNGAGRNRIARVGNYLSSGEINVFSQPATVDSCDGEAYVSVEGTPDFMFDLGNGTVVTSSGYAVFDNLCPGIYSLLVTNGNGDTLTTNFVIPSDSTYILVDPFGDDDIIADSVSIIIENCSIDYNSLDTVYIDSYMILTGDSVLINWAVIDMNGTTIIPTVLVLTPGNIFIQLQLYCPNKSINKYFVATIGLVYNGNGISTLGLDNVKNILFEIYPNPTNNQVQINFSGSDAELTVYDLQGKMVLKDIIQNQGIISLENFERGVYLFDIRNSQGQSVQRVVKQ